MTNRQRHKGGLLCFYDCGFISQLWDHCCHTLFLIMSGQVLGVGHKHSSFNSY